jgi:hypothetical protein
MFIQFSFVLQYLKGTPLPKKHILILLNYNFNLIALFEILPMSMELLFSNMPSSSKMSCKNIHEINYMNEV